MHVSPDLIGLVYDCALDARLWPRALERVSDTLGGGPAALLFQNQVTKGGSGATARLDPAALAAYYSHFGARNPLTVRNNIARKALPVVTDAHVIAKPDLMNTEYYNDFFKPNGMHSALMITIGVHGQSVATVNVMRPHHAPEFDAADIELGGALQPHLARAFRLALKLSDQTGGALFEIMERSPHGLFLIGEDGRVRHVNKSAAAMLGDGLTVTNGELAAASPEASRALRRLIGQASGRRHERRSGGALSLPRPSLRRPFAVIVTPLGRDAMQLFDVGPSVLICVCDPEAAAPLPQQRLRDLFGMTAAEASVAIELLAGHDIRNAAAQLGVSVNTVRVHLARILDKTQTSRQPQLIRLLMSVTGQAL